MLVRSVCTFDYLFDLQRLVRDRLARAGELVYDIHTIDNGICIQIDAERSPALTALAAALGNVLCYDIQYSVFSAYIDRMPYSLIDKQKLLTNSLYTARRTVPSAPVQKRVLAFLENNSYMILEGFLHFRMHDVERIWQLCIERNAQELSMQHEYAEFLKVMQSTVRMRPPRIRELSLCLNPDGSCTLTDDSDTRIVYENCLTESLLNVLVHLAPERLVVYDLTAGAQDALSEALLHVFAGRIQIYH